MRLFSLSLSLLSFSLLSLFTFRISSGQNLILDTCKLCSQNDPNVNLDFCTSSLQAAATTSPYPADLQGLGVIAIRLVKFNLTDTRCHVKQLLKKLDPNVNQSLADCFELYTDAITSIKQAMQNYKSKQYEEANIELSSVMDAATSCEDGFRVSPLTKRNNDTFELTAMALSIMFMLQT